MLLLCEGKEERQEPGERGQALARGSAEPGASGMWQGWSWAAPAGHPELAWVGSSLPVVSGTNPERSRVSWLSLAS